ncbi:hypothetical protein NLG97_g761 [Lecanicillium saksenae]|uniref:Uncharacterized protein n=1 Tax=Lecanicillium saksenae TaxID=468837 RepID=A0ACC1R6B6_9HYPO|nr:hypothetical protein NLG97_g761 [Lecanicillium saksenae]
MVLPSSILDVVVVGAGLSGLRAATAVHDAQLSYVVLEALDRVGGKTLSVSSSADSSGVVDLGAAWINDSSQSEMFALAKEFGFDLIQQRAEGSSLFQDATGAVSQIRFGMPANLTPQQELEFYYFVGNMSQYVDRSNLSHPHLGPDAAKLDSMTALDLVKREFKSPLLVNLTHTLSRALLGVEPGEMSALYFVDFLKSGTGILNISSDEKHGAQYLRNQQGNQNFAVRLAAKLRPGTVQLSSAVKRIVQVSGYSIVQTTNGKVYFAKKVIVSTPTPLLKRIDFVPPLPQAKSLLSRSTKLGYYSKTVLIYSDPWWRHANLSGAFSSHNGPISFTRDTCAPSVQQYSITCFHVGEPGRQWSKLSGQQRQKAVLDQFQQAFGTVVKSIPAPINIIEKEWTKQDWVEGNPNPVMMPGIMTSAAGQSIREPYRNVHFVGTETSLKWKGYMEGAILSGIRGAAEVIEELKRNNP